MDNSQDKDYGYHKKSLWLWIVIYLVIGLIVYGGIYSFVSAKKGGYNYSKSNPQTSEVNPTPIAKNSIEISGYKFSPATLTVKVGDTVTWTNQDSVEHSTTADDNSFDTGLFAQGESKTVTFDKAGTYPYYCSAHPQMRGTVVVQ